MQLFDYSLAGTGSTFDKAQKRHSQVGKIVYQDYLWHSYCEKRVEKVVQKEEVVAEFSRNT